MMSTMDLHRQRSHSFSITRPFSPVHGSTLRPSIRGLPSINEDRPQTEDGIRAWDTFSMGNSGQMSPTFSSAQFSTTSNTSNWFNGSKRHPLGRKDAMLNMERLETLARMSRKYEDSLRSVSEASMQFAHALEEFSRTKELNIEDDGGGEGEREDLVEGFRSLSGYQYFTGSQQRVLAQLVNQHCTAPLEAQLEAYRNTLTVPTHDPSQIYKLPKLLTLKNLHKSFSKEYTAQTNALKKKEKHHLQQSRKKSPRDLNTYRKGLEELTHNLDLLDALKYEHYETVASHTRKVWKSVLKRTTLAARAQVDVLERVAERGVVNDCLGRMVVSCKDPCEVEPEGIVEGILRVEVVQPYLAPIRWTSVLMFRLLEPLNGQGISVQSEEREIHGEENSVEIPEINGPTISAPTAPSPPLSKPSNPFDTIDDVPSIHSETDDVVSQVQIPRIPSDIPTTMTPPLTPPTIITEVDVEGYEEGSPRLFTRLGGYGWRG